MFLCFFGPIDRLKGGALVAHAGDGYDTIVLNPDYDGPPHNPRIDPKIEKEQRDNNKNKNKRAGNIKNIKKKQNLSGSNNNNNNNGKEEAYEETSELKNVTEEIAKASISAVKLNNIANTLFDTSASISPIKTTDNNVEMNIDNINKDETQHITTDMNQNINSDVNSSPVTAPNTNQTKQGQGQVQAQAQAQSAVSQLNFAERLHVMILQTKMQINDT